MLCVYIIWLNIVFCRAQYWWNNGCDEWLVKSKTGNSVEQRTCWKYLWTLQKWIAIIFAHISSEQLYRFEMDTMASFLIPFDLSLHYTRFQQSRHWTMETAYLIQCHFFFVIRTDCLLSYDFWLLPSFLWMLTNSLIIQSYNSLMIAQRSPMTGKTCLLYYYVRKQAL